MNTPYLRFAACALLSLMLANGRVSARDGVLVITGVRIVDVKAGTLQPAADVEIVGERIARIRPAGAILPSGAVVLDGSGAYLVPGFLDMHAHVNSPEYARQWLMPRMLAAGVTGVRDMGGDCLTPGCPDSIAFMRSLQAAGKAGEFPGPRILGIGSAVVNGPRDREAGTPVWAAPSDAAQARQYVREVKARGVDFIKPYDTLPRAAFFALVREANRVRLPVSGHVPLSVSAVEAVEAGQVTIEHAKHPLFDCSRNGEAFRQHYAAWAEGKPGTDKMSVGEFYASILEGYDEALCTQVMQRIRRSGAYYVPTLITRKFEALADEKGYLVDARLASVPPDVLSDWNADAGRYQARFAASAEYKQSYVKLYERAVQLVGKAHAAGIPILVGTDSPDSYSFPGSSYHDEMGELRAAGLSNAAILEAATWNAAKFLDRTADFGSVEAGKVADLVLLGADPLVDIANAAKVRAVIVGGRVFDEAALGALDSQTGNFVKSLPVPTADLFKEFDGADRPGCSVGVMRDGRLIDAAAYGMADIANRKPLSPDTVYNIASVSKQFTAFGILLLEQRGALSIDDSITKYVPGLGEYARPVTLRHLLNHTGGLRDYYALLLLDGHELGETTTREQALEVLGRQRGANFAPNTRYEYSNTGYFLLGVAIERVSGKSLREFMRENVFAPLGMTSSTIVDHYPDGIAQLARGYSAAGSGFVVDESPWEQTGDGQVHTTVQDMARWERNFLTGTVGGLALIARMHEPAILASGVKLDYADGVALGRYRGLPTARHGGDWMGYRAHYLRFPEQRFAAVVLCNRSGVLADRYTAAIADRYLAAEMKEPRPEPVADSAVKRIEPAVRWVPARLASYAGRFRSPEAPRSSVEIEVRQDRLVMSTGNATLPLRPVGPDVFEGEGLIEQGDAFTLRFTEGPRPGFTLSTGGLLGLRFERRR